MSLKGGYQIIDLKNEPFDTVRGTTNYYKNIYHDIANSHAKMIIISGLNMDGVKYNDYEVIFYEVREGDDILYQCILRRIWETLNYKCFTKFCTIYPDDTVKCTVDEFVYEILPDAELNPLSDNAVQNSVIAKKFDEVDILTKSWNVTGKFRAFSSTGSSMANARCYSNYIIVPFTDTHSWGTLATPHYITFDASSEYLLYLQRKYDNKSFMVCCYQKKTEGNGEISSQMEYLLGTSAYFSSDNNYIQIDLMGGRYDGYSCDGLIIFLP